MCGKTYTACNTNRHFDGSFHWREVACSPDCGKIYLQRVMASRGEATAQTEPEQPKAEPEKPAETAEVPETTKPRRAARRSSFFAAARDEEDGKDSAEKE